MSIRGIFKVGTCLASMAALTIMAGCPSSGTVVDIREGNPIPGVTTPGIRIVTGPGLQALPAGFHACYDSSYTVNLPGDTYTNVRVCIYCADSEADQTVYVQYNCDGNYYKGIRNPTSGQPATQPAPRACPPWKDPSTSMEPQRSHSRWTTPLRSRR